MFQKRMLSLAVTLVTCGSLPFVAQAQQANAQDEPLLEEILVQGVRQAEMNAREIERNKDIFSSVISQDDAGNFADQNVAEALQRLPGVTLTKSDGQGEFVNIRGMGAGFVGVSMNNSELASASGEGRAVGLNTIPADLMGSIEVFKSLTPDMDLNSIAGRVNVNSVTAFSRGEDSLRLTLQGAQHEQRGQFSPKATLIGTKLLADETIGIAVSLSHEERGTEVNQTFNESGMTYIRLSRPGMGVRPEYTLAGNQYSSRDRADSYFYDLENRGSLGADPYMDISRMLVPNNFEIRQDESERARTAATFDFGWRPTSNSEYYARLSRTDYTDEELTLRELYNFGASDHRHIAYAEPNFDPIPELDLTGDNLFAVGNADLQQRIVIEKANDINTTYTLGGENIFAETWTLDYEYHHSSSERTNPNDRRVQFRKRSLPMLAQIYKDDIHARIIAPSQLGALANASGTGWGGSTPGVGSVPGAQGSAGPTKYELGETYQPHMAYDNLNLEDGLREDEVSQIQVNLRRDFANDYINYVKGGVLIKERERLRDRAVWNVNPQDFVDGCQGDLQCALWANTTFRLGEFDTYMPRNPRIDHEFITIQNAEALIAATRRIPLWLDPLRSGAASNSKNYSLFENSDEAYLMAEFQIADNATLIAGARYVKTEFGSTGYLTMRHDRFAQEEDFVRDIVIPLTDPNGSGYVTNTYDGVYPGAHLRWDVTDQWLARAAVWTSYTRPSFGQASAGAEFGSRIKLCRETPLNEGTDNERARCSDNLVGDLGTGTDPGLDGFVGFISEELSLAPGGNPLQLGNTDLKAMESTNFDASLSWYGDNGQFFEVAAFYKDVTDYIVGVRGLSMDREDLPLNVRQAVDRIDSTGSTGPVIDDFTMNVFKIDENFQFHNVTTSVNGDSGQVYGVELSYSQFFDNGLFFSSNLTLLDSKADAGETVRAEETKMPNQADITSNLSVGWENDMLSARLIGNYRSEILTQIGTCSQADIDRDAEWADLNNVNSPNALPGAVGDGTVYPEYCQSWSDVFHDDIFGVDFKATYNLNSDIKFYFDVLNITEDVDVFYYRGNADSSGNVLQKSEGLGRTYQVGVNVRF